MANSLNLATLATLAVLATLLGHTSAATYVVGHTQQWTFANSTAYVTWAAQYNFTVGDVLVFNFVTGSHTVATVSKASFDTCTKTTPIALNTTGPASITLTSPGATYFICTIGEHCASASQKLAINVTGSSSTPPSGGVAPSPPPSAGGVVPPTPSTSGVAPSPPPSVGGVPSTPPPSAATRTNLANIFTIFMLATIYLLF